MAFPGASCDASAEAHMMAHMNLRRGSCDPKGPYVRTSACAAFERRRGHLCLFRLNLEVLSSAARCTLARWAGWRGARVRKLARSLGESMRRRAAGCLGQCRTSAPEAAKSPGTCEQLKRGGSGATQGPQPIGAGRVREPQVPAREQPRALPVENVGVKACSQVFDSSFPFIFFHWFNKQEKHVYHMALRSPNLDRYWRDVCLEGFVCASTNLLFVQYLLDMNVAATELHSLRVEVEESLSWTSILCR